MLFQPSVRFLGRGVLKILGMKVVLQGKENLDKRPCIFLNNHQSALDVALLGYICPYKTVPVGKKEIANIPVVGWWFAGCGGRLIDRQSRASAIASLDSMVDFLHSGFSVGLMPEGTRNKTGKGLLPFKKGPFHLAIKAQVPLVPIMTAPLANIASWKTKKINPSTIYMRILDPIPTQGLNESNVEELMEKAWNIMSKSLEDLGKL